MLKKKKAHFVAVLLAVVLLGFASFPAAAAERIEGQVEVGGHPLARSEVHYGPRAPVNPSNSPKQERGLMGGLSFTPKRPRQGCRSCI